MDRDAHKTALSTWLEQQQAPEIVPIALGRALYAASELGLWPANVLDVSADQAIMCWRIIERIRASGEFPEGLRM